LTQSVFRFSGDNYTPALSINSAPKAHEKGKRLKKREERRLKAETYSLASKNSENYFFNQGANTLRSSTLSRNLQNQARRNSQVEAV